MDEEKTVIVTCDRCDKEFEMLEDEVQEINCCTPCYRERKQEFWDDYCTTSENVKSEY